jgi:hypothetical protein
VAEDPLYPMNLLSAAGLKAELRRAIRVVSRRFLVRWCKGNYQGESEEERGVA